MRCSDLVEGTVEAAAAVHVLPKLAHLVDFCVANGLAFHLLALWKHVSMIMYGK